MSDPGRISRRQFLVRAGAALAALPAAAPRAVAGARWPPPSERIAIGVIGLKKMGGVHVETLLGCDDVQIVAVCDVDSLTRQRTRQKVEQTYGQRRRAGTFTGCDDCNEYEHILERPDVDAVLIATPDHWHAKIAIDACRAGKDVYCEKPLSLTVREARAMVTAARRYHRVFQTGTQQRSGAEFRRACELVRNGCIGDVRSVHVEVGPPSRHVDLPEEPVPAGFDYERWLGPAPWAPYNRLRVGSYYDDGWRRIRDYSGGKMTDWGAHHFDIVQWGLGMDDSGPVEIIPPPRLRTANTYKASDPRLREGAGASAEADPTWGLTYRYANGVEVIKDGTNGVLFVGTEGRVEVNRGHLRTWPESLKTATIGPNDLHLYESPGHHRNWLDCIRRRCRPVSDVEIGCRSVTVCHLGNLALWLGRTIQWDPGREQLLGDEYAARGLDRPKRAPYRL